MDWTVGRQGPRALLAYLMQAVKWLLPLDMHW